MLVELFKLKEAYLYQEEELQNPPELLFIPIAESLFIMTNDHNHTVTAESNIEMRRSWMHFVFCLCRRNIYHRHRAGDNLHQ